MAVTVNASTSSGLVWSSDLTGAMQLQTNGTTVANTDTSGNFAFNSGYGTSSVAYGCRAWCNFNSSGSNIASLAGGNVTSVTYNSIGNYTANFTNAMPDTNFSYGGSAIQGTFSEIFAQNSRTTTSATFSLRGTNGQAGNSTQVSLIVMR